MPRHLQLRLAHEHRDDDYPEIGVVSSLFWRKDRTFFAIVSTRSPGTTRIRPYFRSKFGQRLSIYSGCSKSLVGCISGFSGTIVDVCFHSKDSTVLISTADYDGGYFFSGELTLWNWQKKESQVLASGPAFYSARFVEPATVVALVSPLDEEDVDNQDPFQTFRQVSISLDTLPSEGVGSELLGRPYAQDVQPLAEGFELPVIFSPKRNEKIKQSQAEVYQLIGVSAERGCAVDLLVFHSTLLVSKSQPALERRDLMGHLIDAVRSEFSGAQVFALQGDSILFSTNESVNPLYTSHAVKGKLWVLRSESAEPFLFLEGVNPFLLSQALDGTILVRSCGHYSTHARECYRQPVGVDFLMDKEWKLELLPPLGSYSGLFNYITTRGSERLYCTGPDATAHGLALYSVGPKDVTRCQLDLVDKLTFAPEVPQSHQFLGAEVFSAYKDESGEDLIGAGYIANTQSEKWMLWRHDLVRQRWKWQRKFSRRIHLILSIPSKRALLVGLDEGFLMLLAADTGETLDEMTLSFAGIPSLAMEACFHDDRCIVATLEDRILHFQIDSPA